MSGHDVQILLGCLIVVITVAMVVHRLRPLQQLVVLVGVLALLCQVAYPPCINPDGTKGHRWVTEDTAYFKNRWAPCVDVGQEARWMSATVGAVLAACYLLERRHRSKAATPPEKR